MIENIPVEIAVEAIKTGLFKRTYHFSDEGKAIAHLDYRNSFRKTAAANIKGKEFSITRRGFWTHYIEIVSPSHQPYNIRVKVNWRSKMKITDFEGNPFVFKSTSIWKNQWAWLDRYGRPLIEIRSRVLSRKNRGLVQIKYPEMKDALFWVVISWFVILCSESDAASASA